MFLLKCGQTRVGLETGVNKKSIKSDLARIDRMRDADIDYSDIPPLDKSFLKKATTAWPPAKKQLTIRLDADVLAWLKGHGKGYQTRINRILRVVMESQPPGQLIGRTSGRVKRPG
jgi:uncharacterized protein (DUF4415 family)